MEYSEHFAGHARIAILQLLAGQQELRLNTRLLMEAFDVMDLPVTRDGLRTQLAWLAEQGLVTVASLDSMTIARLTDRGLDVAQGRARVPGVAKPSR